MNRRKILWGLILTAVLVLGTGFYILPRIQEAQAPHLGIFDPKDICELVSLRLCIPGGQALQVAVIDIVDPLQRDAILNEMQARVEGVPQILADAMRKDPSVQPTLADNCRMAGELCSVSAARGQWPSDMPDSFFDITYEASIPLKTDGRGVATTFMIAYDASPMPSQGNGIAVYTRGNVVPSARQPEVDPFIIVNAEPYWFISWHWWAWAIPGYPGHLVWWDYWWYDSHNHPNWYWGVYWWWRSYIKYYYGAYWVLWFPWYWHWTYWRHWNWWSTWFPYIDP